ncbi:unnamed protein product [Zymoseptoria tritici ST99CH_1A5]|uniref:Swt1-like HEPN domain-containing protein n=1 Tax=Zymoseptoria tritici ST99CH_1A5 TaxID=1276529 RepID=A0A1Y6M1W2_ZYMTR|nr:unnamed protein product [Zymoseptoria tritici ST99CH_1A5]
MSPIRRSQSRRLLEKPSGLPRPSLNKATITRTLSSVVNRSPRRRSRRLLGRPSRLPRPSRPKTIRTDSGWGDHVESAAYHDPDADQDQLDDFDNAQKSVREAQEALNQKAAQNQSAGTETSVIRPSSLPLEDEGEEPYPNARYISEITAEESMRLHREREAAVALREASILVDRQAREALSSHKKLAIRSPEASWVYIPTYAMRHYLQQAYDLTQGYIYDFGRSSYPSKYLLEWDFEGDVRIERDDLRHLFGENGLYSESSSLAVKNHYRDLIETLVAMRNAWAHPGELDKAGASDPKILDIYLCAVEELAFLIGDIQAEASARRLRIEVEVLAEEIFGDILALFASSQTSGQLAQWEMHHQRCFDWAIHSKKSNSTKLWDELPAVLQMAAEDWDHRYKGKITPS